MKTHHAVAVVAALAASPRAAEGVCEDQSRTHEAVEPVEPVAWPSNAKFSFGQLVRKRSGSWWEGRVCGWYSTDQTPIGYAVQQLKQNGPVQIFPEAAFDPLPSPPSEEER